MAALNMNPSQGFFGRLGGYTGGGDRNMGNPRPLSNQVGGGRSFGMGAVGNRNGSNMTGMQNPNPATIPNPTPQTGPVMAPSVGITPMSGMNIPSNARTSGGIGGVAPTGYGGYPMQNMTPPSYTPPNPNPNPNSNGGIWDRFNAIARQRQY
jgi:hypothetical protein